MKIAHFPNNLPNNAKEVYPQVLEAIGSTDELITNGEGDAALIWSVLWYGRMGGNKQIWERYREQGKPVIVIEVGGLIRNGTWKLGINGINRDANFAIPDIVGDERRKKLGVELKPWQDEGEYILICGQHGHSEQWKHMPDMDTYYKQTIDAIRQFSDKPIVVRSHPRFREGLHWACDQSWYKDQGVTWNIPKHIQETYDSFDLEHMLKHTHYTVSHSSNAGLTSILHGVPAVVSESSLAYDMGSAHDALRYMDREEWINKLCYVEYYPDEIQDQWRRLRNFL